MRLLILKTFSTDAPEFTYIKGAEIDASDDLANSLIAKGLASRVSPKRKTKAVALSE